jgi:hypothetical protein
MYAGFAVCGLDLAMVLVVKPNLLSSKASSWE